MLFFSLLSNNLLHSTKFLYWQHFGIECNKGLFNTPNVLCLDRNTGRGTCRTDVGNDALVFVKNRIGSGVIGGYMVAVYNESSQDFRISRSYLMPAERVQKRRRLWGSGKPLKLVLEYTFALGGFFARCCKMLGGGWEL